MLKPGTVVVCRLVSTKKWVVATVSEKSKLTKKKSVAKLADVKDDGFITLNSYLKLTKSEDEPGTIMDTLACNSLYVKYEEAVNPDSKGVKQWEKVWWSKYNEMCQGCQKKCKQSSHVNIVSCGTYVRVK